MAYHATCNSEITAYFPSGWDGRLFWQIDGILTPDCAVSWSFVVSDGMESYFNHSDYGLPDAYFAWLSLDGGDLVYPAASCDVTVTVTVTCNGEEIGVFTAVAHLLMDEE